MESTVEEILKTVERFRILCVGRVRHHNYLFH